MLQVYQRVRILLLKYNYELLGKSVMAIRKGALKGRTGLFYGCEKDKKIFWSADLFIFKRRCIYSRKNRMERPKLGM